MTRAIVALGVNLSFGDLSPREIIAQALAEFPRKSMGLEKVSRFYQTPAFPKGAGPDYVNAAAVISLKNGCDGSSLLRELHEIEAVFGRKREKRWGARTLDIDLLAFGDSVQPDLAGFNHWLNLPLDKQLILSPQELILPHPRLHERAFVLVPMADVAPDWHHPVLGKTVREMLAELPAADRAEVKPLEKPL